MGIFDSLFGGPDDKDKDNGGNTGEKGGNDSWTGPILGTDSNGNDVTVAFGKSGTGREGEVLISDGHKTPSEFYGSGRDKGHDHYGGKDKSERGDRGMYTGDKTVNKTSW